MVNSIKYCNDSAPATVVNFTFEEKSSDADKLHPVFSFEAISKKANDKCVCLVKNKEASHEFLKRIEKLSSMTWEEIKKSSKKTYGFELLPFATIKGCS